VYDRDTLERPVDIDLIGTLNFYKYTYVWDALTNTELREFLPLKHHVCQVEELQKWPNEDKII
jgi:hypothetical protein